MNLLRITLLALCLLPVPGAVAAAEFAFAIHGGAGTLSRTDLDADKEAAVRAALDAALDAGESVLKADGSALDAVTAALVILEDSPWFNAGHGAVFNAEGVNELDASIMDGATRRAGAIAAVHRVRNPIRLARAVMEHSPHVMLIGDGAEQFARGQGIDLVDPSYFRTDARWKQLEAARAKERAGADLAPMPGTYFGTVGAVAVHRQGRLAAATSTGGMTNKRWGRVGDSPIIGAGTYADDRCAVSATGWGEFFIRAAVAHDLCARMRYAGQPIEQASREVLDAVAQLGGDGGLIAIDRDGNIALPFNTAGMYRGWIRRDGRRGVAIFADDHRD